MGNTLLQNVIGVVIDLLLKRGFVIVNGIRAERSVGIKKGKIHGVYKNGKEPTAKKVIDCRDKFILPGVVDIHVHMRDLEQAEKEDYRTGTMAAAAGGVTTVVDMPNSVPPVLDRSVLYEKIESAREKRFVNVGFYAGIPKKAEKFNLQLVRDILGLKIYPHAPLERNTRYTKERIRKCFELARASDRPLLVHPDLPQDESEAETVESFFSQHSCENEVEATRKFIAIGSTVGGRLHICHVSCAQTAQLILEKRDNDALTAETTPHYLFLSASCVSYDTGIAKMLPPLRTSYDNQTLWSILCKNRAIDCVASDHAPHRTTEKNASFLTAAAGIPGLETVLPLMITAVLDGKMSWEDYLRVCCHSPARIIGLKKKGMIAIGFDADLVVVAEKKYKIKGREFYSKAKITPFEGWTVKAKPVLTIVGGKIVYSFGEFMVDSGIAGEVPVRKC